MSDIVEIDAEKAGQYLDASLDQALKLTSMLGLRFLYIVMCEGHGEDLASRTFHGGSGCIADTDTADDLAELIGSLLPYLIKSCRIRNFPQLSALWSKHLTELRELYPNCTLTTVDGTGPVYGAEYRGKH